MTGKVFTQEEILEQKKFEARTIEFPFEVDFDAIKKDLYALPYEKTEKILNDFDKYQGKFLDAVMDLTSDITSYETTYSNNLRLIKNAVKTFHRWVDPVLPYWDYEYNFYNEVEKYVFKGFDKSYRDIADSDVSKFDSVEFYNIWFLYDLLDYYETNSEKIKSDFKKMKQTD